MVEKIKKEWNGYMAAKKAVEQIEPKSIEVINSDNLEYRKNSNNSRKGVGFGFSPGDRFIRVWNLYEGSGQQMMSVHLDNITAVIEALTLFQSGDINNLPEGWHSV